ncbi:tetratricopeptide repeat protein [Rubrivirga sp. IMCC43871]|uniref:tetratricopeptide repeat protein n=1 Tax=Rubrivirga sp. IMCC43871 TaxID=3391575 RepID=UPI00398FAE56
MRVRTVALLAPAVLALAYALAACGGPGADPVAAADDGWTYVGDGACQQCHADLAASYARTGMGRSLSRFDPATAPERFGPDGTGPVVCSDDGWCYQPFVRGDSLFQRETRTDTPEYARVEAVDYVVGSGNATRSYLMAAGGAPGSDTHGAYLTEMPLTWYVERELWDLSPGYDQRSLRFDRPITLDCLTCHDARPGHEPSQNYFTDVPLGISCERCHGPGSAHVAAFEAGGSPSDSRIVNPAALDPGRQLDVCQQCHLTGETVYAPGEDATTYRPGRPLAAHRSVFVSQASLDDPVQFGIASHAERMMRSACFTESAGTARPMTCTTCHDPHVPTAELAADYFNVTCASCHGPSAHLDACSRPEATTAELATAGDCVSCHMRSAGTSDIPHVAFTDHWIRRDPPPSERAPAGRTDTRGTTPYTLVDLAGERRTGPDADADLAVATFALYETGHPLPAYLPRITRLARGALAAGVERTDVRVALGRALAERDSLAAAREVLAEAVDRDPASASAALWLGVVESRRGRHVEAAEALREAVRLAPRLTEARVRLGTALFDAGRAREAADVLAEAVAQDPLRHPDAWNALGLAHLGLGATGPAVSALRRAVALDPRLAVARANLGAALLAAGDPAAARAQLEAALRIDPDERSALGNLGVALGQLGRTAEARDALERLLRLDPTDARARAALAGLE